MSCVVFTGGGTAGHIYPGIAVAEALPQDVHLVWLGSHNGKDEVFVKNALQRIKFIPIPSGKYRRYFSVKSLFQNFVDLFKIGYAFVYCFFLLKKLKPSLLFSKGGFVSTPPCMAARILKIPVITHECDASPGLATRLNARFATKILTSYPETKALFKAKYRNKVIYTGNPVRSFFSNADGKKTKDFLQIEVNRPILLILGGSLGAEQINSFIYENIEKLLESFIVVHQTGATNIERANSCLAELKAKNYKNAQFYLPKDFIKEELADLIFSASIVISRSGSNTVWELASLGKAMILIPLEKGASRGDQVENASYFSNKKAAIMLCGSESNSTSFIKQVMKVHSDDVLRQSLGENAKMLAQKDVALNIAKMIGEVISNNQDHI